MSTLLLGDLHLGNHKWEGGELINGVNRRCRELLTAMRAAVDDAMALSPDLSAVVQVGDFFDQSRPDPAVVHAALELMRSYPNLDWHLMVGNHDLRAFGSPSALAPLGHVPGIYVYDQPTQIELEGLRYCLIPYISHSAKDALEMSRSVAHHADVLVLHYGVVSEASRPDQISKQDISFYCAGKPWIISGHEHGERTTEPQRRRGHYNCVGLGSFADLDWSAARFEWPHAIIVEQNCTIKPVAVDGPHFTDPVWNPVIAKWQSSLLTQAINSRGRGLYVEVQADRADYAKVLQSTGLIQGWRVTPEKKAVGDVSAPTTERMGFGDLESPIAEVLDSRGEDLSDETTHRVWSRCLAHMKEK
jgi:hypothetical protein